MGAVVVGLALIASACFAVAVAKWLRWNEDAAEASRRRGNKRRRAAAIRYGWGSYTHELANGRLVAYNV